MNNQQALTVARRYCEIRQASMNRYHQFDWQAGAPQPGELDYLTGCELRHTIRGSMNGAITYNRGPQPWANGYHRPSLSGCAKL